MVAMAAEVAVALALAVMILITLSREDREEWAEAAEAAELINLARRRPKAAILLAEAAVQVVDHLMAPLPWVEMI